LRRLNDARKSFYLINVPQYIRQNLEPLLIATREVETGINQLNQRIGTVEKSLDNWMHTLTDLPRLVARMLTQPDYRPEPREDAGV
jgi:hypothetical protein